MLPQGFECFVKELLIESAYQAVTGKSFGDKDFRSALENGILLCELLSAIKPGLVKKINRLPTPIAGLDNLSVFLRGCEELGLKGAQLFDPGDLQDTSIRANLKDSDCNRKLKNVLNTVFWLGKAASGCASYSGPTLNLKDFEGLLAQMRVVSEHTDSQKRSVRDSGYDCWDSERSESLSPPRHTRDNSLDSLDSFGSRSQHSPSPDVVNRANSDGDSEADASGKRPDMRKDDMLARRTATSEARSSVPFNQFLPNRANASTYVLGPRRKHHSEEDKNANISYFLSLLFLVSRSASMGDLLNEDEVGHLPHISPSRYERMQEQYSNFKEDENQWQDDLARWKNRRRSASQDLIKKEEERKMIEKKMKEESDRRKSIKTYKEIIEEKERREAELCEAYRNAATPEEAAMVLQRYALRFTISDATLDSLKVPRPVVTATSPDYKQTDKELKPSSLVKEEDTEVSEQHKTVIKTDNKHDTEHADFTYKQEDIVCLSSIPTPPISPLKTPDLVQSQAKVPPAPSPLQRTPTLPSGNKSFKMDGLVRVNGETTETSSIHTPPLSPMRSPVGAKPATPASPTTPISPEKPDKDAPCERTVTIERTVQPSPPPSQTEKPPSATSSAISSLIGGRNCIITTTIVTELTHVEPVTLESHTNGQTETPMLNLAKRVNHWVWDPNVERKRLERWQQEQERLLQEQYEKEQEKLKKEWERAQLEVEEEERKHNEEVTRLVYCFYIKYCMNIHWVSVCYLFRCVSGKRLCSGCSQPLGKGAAMIIDTLGLFFHMQCFKCGVCDGQLGDATAGTDVRIRNGQLSCHECYIASRGRGQPTTL
uniref:Uncharacterized protein n=1 Tax=Periophthalmus magnuspinnatus TaxID=409849 RepID=A0A3B4AVU5_9GOBI